MFRILALTSLLAVSPVTASAITIDLSASSVPDFLDGEVQSGDQAFGPGVTVTFSNILGTGGAGFAFVNDDGPIFASTTGFFGRIISVDLTFNVPVQILSINIDDLFPDPGATMRLSGLNGVSGDTPVDAAGDIPFVTGGLPVLLPGEAYTLTHTVSGNDTYFRLDELEVAITTVPTVPLPGALTLLGLGLGGLAVSRRRHP